MTGARILVVDDSPTILKVVTGMLTRAGFVTQTARDGLIGIELIKRGQSFDLVLLDFVMPRMNGYQFCRELRAVVEGDILPVVLMSAKADKIKDQFRSQTGAVGALAKPFDARSLLHAIDAAFAKAKEIADARAVLLTERADDAETKAGVPLMEEGRGDLARRVGAAAAARILRMSQRERMSPQDLEKAIVDAFHASGSEVAHAPKPAPSRSASIAPPRLDTGDVLAGDLSIVPLAEVMQLLQMQRQTGVLRIKDGARLLTVCLRDGLLDLARLDGGPSELRLGRYFLEQGVATRADVEEAVLRARRSGKLLGDELVDAGIASDAAREEALRMQSSELVYDVLRWRTGRFWLVQEAFTPAAERARLGLGMAGLLLEGFRRLDEWRAIEGTISWDKVVTSDPAARASAPTDLSRAERLVLGAVDGRRTVREVVAESNLASFDALKVLHHFLRSRVLRA